jgi:phosphate transport system substrate-binding protein
MKLLKASSFMALAIFTLLTPAAQAQQAQKTPAVPVQTPIDPALPLYKPGENVSGTVSLAGSMTLAQLAAIWSDSFKQLSPNIQVQVTPKGSTNAMPALINGESDFALLSRPMTETEVKAFQEKYGYLPTVVVPALEQIAIFVHKDNPIESVTLPQIDALFSKTLRRGAAKQATTWGDVGVAGPLSSQPITCLGRRDQTGLQVFFQMAILAGGEFRSDMTENASNIDMIKAIAANPGAVGFGGAAFASPEVKAVPVALRPGDTPVGIHDAHYPLVRPLQIVLKHEHGKQISPAQEEFIKYIFSQRGQQDVIFGGLVPISARPAEIALEAVGVHTLN